MGFREGLVGLLAVAQSVAPNLPTAYRDFFEALKQDRFLLERLRVLQKDSDGGTTYVRRFYTDGNEFFLGYREPGKGQALFITCFGPPPDDPSAPQYLPCYVDGGNYGPFDGVPDAQSREEFPFERHSQNFIRLQKSTGFRGINPEDQSNANDIHNKVLETSLKNPPD